MTPRPQIVVGVDGSPESREALRWAFDYTQIVDGALRVIYDAERSIARFDERLLARKTRLRALGIRL